MIVSPPDWLNKELVSRCLQYIEHEEADILVTSIDVVPAAPPGSSYGSDVFRARVEFTTSSQSDRTRRRSLVVKAPHTDPLRLQVLGHLFKCEPLFYHQFLPLVNQITSQTFAPKCIPTDLPDIVVLEDLKENGYEMIDSAQLLDFDHARLYAGAAATFHASSFVVLKDNPELIKMFIGDKFFSFEQASVNKMRNMWTNAPLALANQMALIEEFRGYAELITSMKEDLWIMMVEAYLPCESLNTLYQGDPWTANMMFSYDLSGRVKDIKLLDFQCVSYASPVGDLVYFIWSSASHEVREHHLEELFSVYCDTFNAKLQELGYPARMTREVFTEALDRFKIIALSVAAFLFPCFVHPLPVDLESLYTDSPGPHMFDRYYDETFRSKHLTRLVRQLEAFGVFDYLKQQKIKMEMSLYDWL